MREKERGRESKRKRLGRILNESIFSISCKFLYSCQWPILGNCCCQSVLPISHVHLWEHWVESIFRLLLDCLIFFHYCSFHTPSLPAPTYRGFFFFLDLKACTSFILGCVKAVTWNVSLVRCEVCPRMSSCHHWCLCSLWGLGAGIWSLKNIFSFRRKEYQLV